MSRWGIVNQSLEGRQRVYFPHWTAGTCPGHGVSAVDLRRWREKCFYAKDRRSRERLRKMCAEDLLFYLTTFVSIYQGKGRLGKPRPVPFLPYEFQAETLTVLWKCMHDDQEDVRIKKNRQMGGTYMVVAIIEHAWHFMPDLRFLLGSRKQEALDGSMRGAEKGGEWDKLLPKIDYVHLHEPNWLLPNGYVPRREPYRKSMRIINPENHSIIEAESANPNWGRGGVYYAMAFDEHAHTDVGREVVSSSSQASECHIWFSSPNGPSTAFAMLGRTDIRQVDLNWWYHPDYARDMTWDPAEGDRSRKSPWLMRELGRIGHDAMLANNEIWADETQSAGCFYTEAFDVILGTGGHEPTVRAPTLVGEIDFEVGEQGPIPTRWVDQDGGRWKLWCHLDEKGDPPGDERYILGVDVAAGSRDELTGRGMSNSTIAVLGETSRSKVAEYATHGVPPHRFAEIVVAAARWFRGCEQHGYIIWDARGPGAQLGDVIVQEYGVTDNIYYHQMERRTSTGSKVRVPTPGWQVPGSRPHALAVWGAHVRMLWKGEYLERSIETVEEMRHFNHNPSGGAPIHSASRTEVDPSGARENHGDRTTATVIACLELKERQSRPERPEEMPAYGSLQHARRLKERRTVASQLI